MAVWPCFLEQILARQRLPLAIWPGNPVVELARPVVRLVGPLAIARRLCTMLPLPMISTPWSRFGQLLAGACSAWRAPVVHAQLHHRDGGGGNIGFSTAQAP